MWELYLQKMSHMQSNICLYRFHSNAIVRCRNCKRRLISVGLLLLNRCQHRINQNEVVRLKSFPKRLFRIFWSISIKDLTHPNSSIVKKNSSMHIFNRIINELKWVLFFADELFSIEWMILECVIRIEHCIALAVEWRRFDREKGSAKERFETISTTCKCTSIIRSQWMGRTTETIETKTSNSNSSGNLEKTTSSFFSAVHSRENWIVLVHTMKSRQLRKNY